MQDKIKELVNGAEHIVVVQADNPDADSLGSSLALEQILSDLGKDVSLYCGVDMPSYLHYLSGWDRVVKDLPKQFDLSIIVDASTYTLLEQLQKTGQMAWLKAKPCAVLDHHTSVERPLDFAAATICDDAASSTGELIYGLANQLGWAVGAEAGEYVMSSILGDTQGLSNGLTHASTYRVMADLVDLGVNRPKLEDLRRDASKMPEIIYRYKGKLIQRTEFAADGRIAHVTIPQAEINEYSPLYNPAVLIQFDTLQILGVVLSVIFKTYDSGRITAKIRAGSSAPVADKLAEHFGGGGHTYASGFKIEGGRDFDVVKTDCLETAALLLDSLESGVAE